MANASSPHERRRVPRPRLREVVILEGRKHVMHARILDVSRQGVSVWTPGAVEVGGKYRLSLETNEGPLTVRAVARRSTSAAPGHVARFEFERLRAVERARIEAFVLSVGSPMRHAVSGEISPS